MVKSNLTLSFIFRLIRFLKVLIYSKIAFLSLNLSSDIVKFLKAKGYKWLKTLYPNASISSLTLKVSMLKRGCFLPRVFVKSLSLSNEDKVILTLDKCYSAIVNDFRFFDYIIIFSRINYLFEEIWSQSNIVKSFTV